MLSRASSHCFRRSLTRHTVSSRTRLLSSSKTNTTDDDNEPPAAAQPATPTANLAVSLFKNPIVHQLWTARQEAKQRRGKQQQPSSSDNDNNNGLAKGKTPSASRVQVSYPFTTDEMLAESYKNPWGNMRFGKMMEDLDALAGNIAFFHVDDDDNDAVSHPVIVTASVDRIRLRQRPSMGADQHLSGQVTWTGTSSMEIRMQCSTDCGSGGGSSSSSGGAGQEWLEAYVTFVTLDPVTKKPTSIPPVLPETPAEQALFDAGEIRAAAKKKRRKQHHRSRSSPDIDEMADALMVEAGPLLNMPSLADPHSILMQATSMQNAMIAQSQMANLHNRIFGGFLMRRAWELAFSTAYVFGGARPLFLEVDDVSFASPVDVGDLLVFNSRVLYTEKGRLSDFYTSDEHFGSDIDTLDQELPLVHIEVEAWVTEPEKASARMSNQFYFTFAMQTETDPAKNVQVRRVLPSNIDEARRMAVRMLVDREQDKDL